MKIEIDTQQGISAQIKKLAKAKGMTMKFACKKAGLTPQAFIRWARIPPKSVASFFRLLDAINEHETN